MKTAAEDMGEAAADAVSAEMVAKAVHAEGNLDLPPTQLDAEVSEVGIEFERPTDPNTTAVLVLFLSIDNGQTWHFHGCSSHEGGPLTDWPGRKDGEPEPTLASFKTQLFTTDAKGNPVPIKFQSPLLKGVIVIVGGGLDASVKVVGA